MNARLMHRAVACGLTSSCLMLGLFLCTADARALPISAGEARIARCIRQVSGGRLWLERTLWGLRDQEAGWIGAEIANSNGTHDLGPMQVNSFWVERIAAITGHPPLDVRYWLIHDACYNVAASKWIFLSGLSASRNYWSAIGLYHSPIGWRRLQYSQSVAARIQSRYGDNVFTRTNP